MISLEFPSISYPSLSRTELIVCHLYTETSELASSFTFDIKIPSQNDRIRLWGNFKNLPPILWISKYFETGKSLTLTVRFVYVSNMPRINLDVQNMVFLQMLWFRFQNRFVECMFDTGNTPVCVCVCIRALKIGMYANIGLRLYNDTAANFKWLYFKCILF